ncbi:MAG: hypothetical protein AAFV62_13045, partial [Pseudomonadota bacterium]
RRPATAARRRNLPPQPARHWHGAAPGHAMTHLAMQEFDAEAGNHIAWAEPVAEEDYAAEPQ